MVKMGILDFFGEEVYDCEDDEVEQFDEEDICVGDFGDLGEFLLGWGVCEF